ncbi:MAG: YncE family protein, partial [bacterium]
MNRTKLLAITTVLIAVMAVIGAASALKGGQKPLKGVYVSGGDKKMYVIDPDTMTVIASKYVGQSSTWPSNQYPGDKYIWLPGGGTQGLTVINSKDLSVACKTGYGSNWVEVTPDNTLAYVTTLGTDTIIKVNGDVSAGCPNTAAPLDKTVYDTTKHDGPCDMTVSPDANWLCIPDIYSGITNGNGMDSITMVNANNLNDTV